MLNFWGSKRLLWGFHTEILGGQEKFSGVKKIQGSINLGGGGIFKIFMFKNYLHLLKNTKRTKKNCPSNFLPPPKIFVIPP